MPNIEHAPKPAATRVKSTPASARDQSALGSGQISRGSANISAEALIRLQRTVGNHALQRMLDQSDAIGQAPSFDNEPNTADSLLANATIQRAIAPLPGKSSGLLKGRRDKINALVTAYNTLERQTTAAKFSLAAYQKLLSDIQKIKTAAATWQTSVATAKPEKAAAIGTWITTELDRETAAKQAQMGEHPEGMKAASDGATYNALYTTPAYTNYENFPGINWLTTPAVAPIYKYFLMQQHEEDPMNAYLDFQRYRKAPSRADAIAIYNKYQLGGSEILNIAGEGVVGQMATVNATRRKFTDLIADPSAPVPADFGAIEQSVRFVLNMTFLTFRDTEPYKKITTPPK